jgi:hypothetical protein
MSLQNFSRLIAMQPAEWSRISIMTGGYGSGKTELAVNACMTLAREGIGASLVDIDVMKPLFRSREARERLSAVGVRTISSVSQLEQADLPALSPEILGAIQNGFARTARVIIDVGGDDVGATALGRFSGALGASGYEMMMVVNPYRPFTRDTASVLKLMELIERRSRLRISCLVSNPNLGDETSPEVILKGHGAVADISSATGLPVRFICVGESLLEVDGIEDVLVSLSLPVFPIRRYMLPPWMDNSNIGEEG